MSRYAPVLCVRKTIARRSPASTDSWLVLKSIVVKRLTSADGTRLTGTMELARMREPGNPPAVVLRISAVKGASGLTTVPDGT